MEFRPQTGLGFGDSLGFPMLSLEQGLFGGEAPQIKHPEGWIPIEQPSAARQRLTMKCALVLLTPDPHPRLSQARYALVDRIVYTPHPRGFPPGSARPPGTRDRGEEGVAGAIAALEGDGREVMGRGDLYFRVKCQDTHALEKLWACFTDGELSTWVAEALDIPAFGKNLGIEDLQLRIELTPGEYLVCLEEAEFLERKMDDVDELRDVMVQSAELARSGNYVGFHDNANGTIEEEKSDERRDSSDSEDFEQLITQIEATVIRPKTPFVGDTKTSRDSLIAQYRDYRNFVREINASLAASAQVTQLRRKQLAQRKRKYDRMRADAKALEKKVGEMEQEKNAATFSPGKDKDARAQLRHEHERLTSLEARADSEKLHIKKIVQQLGVIDPVREQAADMCEEITGVLDKHGGLEADLENTDNPTLNTAVIVLRSCSKKAKIVDRDFTDKLKK